ncbi:MAG: FKBP-type peptidyl-prolyl cis-trans isomerase [Bacteroidales bacterium]|nr:FKBP-type peptidyl-prolyl cis-trans isomerase [Bacteroidales bacterium]
MIIEDKTFVSIKYELRFDSAENDVVEKTTDDNPLSFIVGTGKMMPAFEQKLLNLKIKDNFNFILKPEEAYGMHNPEGIMNLSIEVFM